MKKLAMLASGAAVAFAVALPIQAQVSATAGFVSDYYFRGFNLGDGGAYGSVDFEASGFYAGTWWIDDASGGNDGLETDFYLGYGMEGDAFSWNVGYNRYEYTYTSDFEHEIDVTLGFGPVTFDIIKGEDDDDGFDAEDYTVFIFGYSQGAFGLTIGAGELDDIDDSEWTWLEASFGGELVAGIDASINVGVRSDELETDQVGGQDDGYMYLDFSKSFDL